MRCRGGPIDYHPYWACTTQRKCSPPRRQATFNSSRTSGFAAVRARDAPTRPGKGRQKEKKRKKTLLLVRGFLCAEARSTPTRNLPVNSSSNTYLTLCVRHQTNSQAELQSTVGTSRQICSLSFSRNERPCSLLHQNRQTRRRKLHISKRFNILLEGEIVPVGCTF